MNEEEIKQAFEVMKNGLDNPKEKSEHCFYFDEYQMNTIKNMAYNLEKELAQEKEKNKKLEEVIDIMAEDIINGFVLNFGSIERAEEYYFNKAKEKANDK